MRDVCEDYLVMVAIWKIINPPSIMVPQNINNVWNKDVKMFRLADQRDPARLCRAGSGKSLWRRDYLENWSGLKDQAQ